MELTTANTSDAVAQFWRDFVALEPSLKGLPARERFDKANEILANYFSDIALEMSGSPEHEPMEMIFTAHGVRERFPLVMEITASAPKLEYHRVVAFRQRIAAPERFAFRMMDNAFELSTKKMSFACEPDGGQVGLYLKFDFEVPYDMRNRLQNMAFITLDHVLGEYDFAVKTGFVEFDASEEEQQRLTWTPLGQLPAIFDRFWRDVSGYTGVFLVGEERRWCGLRAETDDGELLVTVHDSARNVAMRADLGWVTRLQINAADNGLETVQDLQDEIDAYLESQREGVMAYAQLQAPFREAAYYSGDAAKTEQLVRQALQRAGIEQFELNSEYDPSWRHYFGYAVHVSRDA